MSACVSIEFLFRKIVTLVFLFLDSSVPCVNKGREQDVFSAELLPAEQPLQLVFMVGAKQLKVINNFETQ